MATDGRLTKQIIDRLQPPRERKSWVVFKDGGPRGVPGHYLRVNPKGTKSFILRYRVGGRCRTYVIGRYGDFTLEQARRRARELRVRIADGFDPVEQRRHSRLNGGDRGAYARTVQELCDRYLSTYARDVKLTWKEDERRIVSFIKPSFGRLAPGSLTKGDVVRFHRTVSSQNGPFEANRALALLHRIYSIGIANALIRQEIVNPAGGVTPNPEPARVRFLSESEIGRLLEAVERETDPYVRAAVLIALCTGARKAEILSLKWKDVDFERMRFWVSNTKGQKISKARRRVPHPYSFSEPLVSVFQGLPSFGVGDEAFVFPSRGRSASGHREDLRRPWQRIRENAKLHDFRFHDFRRTFGSWMHMEGAPLQVVGSQLGHTDYRSTQIYARVADRAQANAVERSTDFILGRDRPSTLGGGPLETQSPKR